MEQVKFVALDREDLEVVSTHLQDALVKVADIMWRPQERRLIVSLSPIDSWFNPLGILDTNTGRITRLAADSLSDRHSGVWTPDGRILAGQVVMRATIWAFQPMVN